MRFVLKHWFAAILFLSLINAQPPNGYYDSAQGKTGSELQAALHNIIDGHTTVSYSALWTHFQSTDKKDNGKVWDMYSDVPGGTPPYEFTFVSNQCGNYGGEGDCYNREHSFPKSWFNEQLPMNTDLFHLYPTDGYVNNRRGNYPYGEVGSATWTSQNGSLVGGCSYPGYSGTVFEPIDAYKGDLARTYFYMATRYYGEDSGWDNTDMTDGAQLDPWAVDMLLEWHSADPVSEKETARNNAVFAIQGNRNPFIDQPEFVTAIWDPTAETSPDFETNPTVFILSPAWPNPFNPSTNFSITLSQTSSVNIKIYDINGRTVRELGDYDLHAGQHLFSWDGVNSDGQATASGIYFINVITGKNAETGKIVLVR